MSLRIPISTSYLDQEEKRMSSILPLSAPTSPGRTARRLSIRLKSRAERHFIPLAIAFTCLIGLVFVFSSNGHRDRPVIHSVGSRFPIMDHDPIVLRSRNPSNLRGSGSGSGTRGKPKNGISLLVQEEEELIAEDDLFWEKIQEIRPLSDEEKVAEAEIQAHHSDVLEQNRMGSLRALIWWIAEGGVFPAKWDIPSKSYLKKIGARGMERLLEDIDSGTDDEAIFEDGWAEFAKRRYRIVVFSKTHCPYSLRAKGIMEKYRLTPAPFVIELNQRPDAPTVQTLLDHLTGRRTVPNIIFDFNSLGGSDELTLLDSEGGLQRQFKDMGVIPGSPKKGITLPILPNPEDIPDPAHVVGGKARDPVKDIPDLTPKQPVKPVPPPAPPAAVRPGIPAPNDGTAAQGVFQNPNLALDVQDRPKLPVDEVVPANVGYTEGDEEEEDEENIAPDQLLDEEWEEGDEMLEDDSDEEDNDDEIDLLTPGLTDDEDELELGVGAALPKNPLVQNDDEDDEDDINLPEGATAKDIEDSVRAAHGDDKDVVNAKDQTPVAPVQVPKPMGGAAAGEQEAVIEPPRGAKGAAAAIDGAKKKAGEIAKKVENAVKDKVANMDIAPAGKQKGGADSPVIGKQRNPAAAAKNKVLADKVEAKLKASIEQDEKKALANNAVPDKAQAPAAVEAGAAKKDIEKVKAAENGAPDVANGRGARNPAENIQNAQNVKAAPGALKDNNNAKIAVPMNNKANANDKAAVVPPVPAAPAGFNRPKKAKRPAGAPNRAAKKKAAPAKKPELTDEDEDIIDMVEKKVLNTETEQKAKAANRDKAGLKHRKAGAVVGAGKEVNRPRGTKPRKGGKILG